ncbi:hypothetical protein P3L10_017568 [Capsicum annuum]
MTHTITFGDSLILFPVSQASKLRALAIAVDNTLPENLGLNHPLFFSPSDNSSAVLISLQLTGSENHSVWSCAMRIAILGRNKLGFIHETCKKENYSSNLAALWKRCNAIVLSWIMNRVSKEILSGLVYSSYSTAMWNDLKERFDKIDGSRIFQLHKEIATIHQGTDTISVYFSKLRAKWVKFDSIAPVPSCDCPKSRDYVDFTLRLKLFQFLMGLNDSYEQARGYILMTIPVPSVNRMKGHTRDVCYKLVGYPNDSRFRKKGRNMNHPGHSQGNFHTAHNAVTHSSSSIPHYHRADTHDQFGSNRRNSKFHKGEWTFRFGRKLERGECSTSTGSKRGDSALADCEKDTSYGLGTGGGFTREQYNQILHFFTKMQSCQTQHHR